MGSILNAHGRLYVAMVVVFPIMKDVRSTTSRNGKRPAEVQPAKFLFFYGTGRIQIPDSSTNIPGQLYIPAI
jgi:hypothetical protein